MSASTRICGRDGGDAVYLPPKMERVGQESSPRRYFGVGTASSTTRGKAELAVRSISGDAWNAAARALKKGRKSLTESVRRRSMASRDCSVDDPQMMRTDFILMICFPA